MRKLLVTLDDELSKKLSTYPNQNEIVRKAVRLYIGDITTDSIEGMRVAFTQLNRKAVEMDSKLDYIAKTIQNKL